MAARHRDAGLAQVLGERAGTMLAALIGLGLLGASGCGYGLGFRPPPGVRTIAVPMFSNNTFPLRREVEYEITSALRRELQARTPLRLVSLGEADMAVHGAVIEFHELVIAEGPRDEKVESSLVVTVDLVVEDYRNRTSVRQVVRDVSPFSIQSGETIALARRRALSNLAEKIVLAIEAW
jgi:hypothetical protein